MSRSQLLFRLLFKAAWVRKDRALTALISVAVVATIATAALTIYSDLEGKLNREFRGFGANVVVTKASGPLTNDELEPIHQIINGHGEVLPVAYAIGAERQSGTRVVIGGADLDKLRQLNPSWSFSEMNQGNALMGSRVAEQFSHAADLEIAFGREVMTVKPAAVFHSGSDDDSRIYLPLADFEKLTTVQPSTALMRVEGRTDEVQMTVSALTISFPELEIKPVRQIAETQAAVVGKTRSVVLAASGVVVVLIMLCMVATFTSSVLERRRDFAVMKALGASNRVVNSLFAAEAALLALTGAVAGYIFGCGIAFWIGKANFDAAIPPQPVLLLPILLGSVLLALVASTAPLKLLQQIQPAAIQRGE